MIQLLAAAILAQPEASIHTYSMKDIDGKEIALRKYKGSVCLVVNVASKCGLTPQYEALEILYKKYAKKGFTILAFPSNDFKSQEPGTNAEIKEFCQKNYGVTFPIFSKIQVLGSEKAPLYSFLIESVQPVQEIEWNFAKFLVGKDGVPIARFPSRMKPDDSKIISAIESALSK